MKNYCRVHVLIVVLLFALVSCENETADAPVPLSSKSISEENMQSGAAEHNKVLAEVRRATARYHRIDVALDAEYVLASHCVAIPTGGMGHHYVNFSLVDGIVDPSQPEVLVYEPQKNGKMKLVAVEFVVVAGLWDAAHDEAPMLGTQGFDDYRNQPASNYGGVGMPNYQLHAWIWQHNPLGIHAPFNPTVTCDFAVQE